MQSSIAWEGYRSMTSADLEVLGVHEIAYVKPEWIEGEMIYAIHAADGTPLTTTDDWAHAYAIIRRNELEPMSAH